MVIYEDTRQQKNKHWNIHRYCRENGIEIIRQGLNVGDYMLAGPGGGGISVDTKYGVPELAMCVFQEHDRFRDECLRAQRCEIQLIVLTEEVPPMGRLENWRSPIGWDGLPMHKFKPDVLKKALITMQEEYGVKFRFCRPEDTGMWVIKALTEGIR